MKNKYVLSILFFTCTCIFANAQVSWQWASCPTTTDSGAAFAEGMYTDAAGNSYVTGTFSGTLTFGPSTITSNISGPYGSFFIAKYNAQGNAVWAKNYGDTSIEYGDALCAGPQGGLYVTGGYESQQLILGPDTMSGTPRGSGTFIARLDSLGNIIWARGSGCGVFGGGGSVCTDASGNAYLTAGYAGATTTFGTHALPAAQTENYYLIKFDSSGNVLWVTTAGGGNYAQGNTLFTDANNNVYVQGNTTDSAITFGNITLVTNATGNFSNMFVVKYDAAGNVQWAKCNQAAGSAQAGAIAYNGGASFYFAGAYSGLWSLGANTLTGPVNSDGEMFVAGLDTSGNVLFLKNEADITQIYEAFNAVALPNGNLCVNSTFTATPQVVFGNDTLNSPQAANHLFTVAFNESGNPLWAIGIADSFGTDGFGIGTDAASNVYVAGVYTSTGAPFHIGNSVLTAPFGTDMFVARIDYNPTAVQQVAGAPAVNVYPNPSTGQYWFTGLQPGNTLQVYDLMGNLISTTQTEATNYTLNLTGKAKGIYLYRITGTGGLIQQGKIVLQ